MDQRLNNYAVAQTIPSITKPNIYCSEGVDRGEGGTGIEGAESGVEGAESGVEGAEAGVEGAGRGAIVGGGLEKLEGEIAFFY